MIVYFNLAILYQFAVLPEAPTLRTAIPINNMKVSFTNSSPPDEIQAYPAHDYNSMMFRTIGEEKRYNPCLQVRTAEEYADI